MIQYSSLKKLVSVKIIFTTDLSDIRSKVRNDEVLRRVEKLRNILPKGKGREVKWIGHILLRNCLLKHVTEGKIKGRIEVTGRRGKRRKQLLDKL